MGGGTLPNVGNSLKPYGLIYQLVSTEYVPVFAVISNTKAKDGVDFTYDGKDYKGGSFIIPAEFRTASVNTLLTTWAGKGVLLTYTTSPLSVDVSYKLTFKPKWALDLENGGIAEEYLKAAEISAAAYSFKLPSALAGCDDIFIMPHADPT